MMRCDGYDIINMELDQGLHVTANLQAKLLRADDASDDDMEMVPASEPAPKRARNDRESKTLPVMTKIYFMEENKEYSRSGVMVTLLSNAQLENGQVDIKALLYENATRHLARRSTFVKDKHRIFYYDTENPNVGIYVDTVASFRAAVEEMFTYRTSEPKIEFCFCLKEELAMLV